MAKDSSSGGVRSLQRALDVLEAVAFSGEELGVTQIADRVKVTKGAVHRHLLTLVERGYLTQNQATARYGIGSKSRLLARLAPTPDLVKLAEGPMRDLRNTLGQSVVLSSMTLRGALVMLTIPGTSAIEIGVRPGSELPFHASAQGKVLLAFAAPKVRKRLLAGPRRKMTEKTVIDPASLEREIIQIVRSGYAVAPEQALLGLNAIAVPIFDESDSCMATVAVVGSIQFLPEQPSVTMIRALKRCGQEISRALGNIRHTGSTARSIVEPVSIKRKAG
jgi:IclR family KDG regulon transcriptional repressor